MIVDALTTVKLVADAPPNETPVAPVKFAPVMVIDVPPDVGPEPGLTDVIVGGPIKEKSPGAVAEPWGVVTTTLAAPMVPGGVVTLIVVALTTVNDAAALPIVTDVAPVKSVPVMTAAVPPRLEPKDGLIEVIVGGTSSTPVSVPETQVPFTAVSVK